MQGRAPWLVLLCSFGLLACDTQPSLPGTALGTYSVKAAIHTNTCGDQLGAPDPWAFDAELSRDGNLLYWRQNGQLLSGALDEVSGAKIVSSQSDQVGKNSSCSMTRTDTLAIKLGTSAAPDVKGGLTFGFSVPASSCSDLLASNGGTYTALPCQIVYTLTATQSKAP
jgi:hypothetical protein